MNSPKRLSTLWGEDEDEIELHVPRKIAPIDYDSDELDLPLLDNEFIERKISKISPRSTTFNDRDSPRPADKLMKDIIGELSQFDFPPPTMHIIPIYDKPGSFHDQAEHFIYRVPAGQSIIDYLTLMHAGTIYLDCVAFIYIMQAIFETKAELVNKIYYLTIIRNPSLRDLPDKAIFIVVTDKNGEEKEHIAYKMDGQYYHMAEGGVIVSPSLTHVCQCIVSDPKIYEYWFRRGKIHIIM